MILGIDPGLAGALAFYDAETDTLEVFDMPVHLITENRKQRHVLDDYQLGRIVRERAAETTLAVIEHVASMPKQGVTSSFRFGESFGAARLAVAAFNIRMELVKPAAWKRIMRVSADKDSSRRRASQLLPNHAHLWPLKQDADRAEAALLALLGERLSI